MTDKPKWWWSRARKDAWHAERHAERVAAWEAGREHRAREVDAANARSLAAATAGHGGEAHPRVPALASVPPVRRVSGTPGTATSSRRDDGPGTSDPGGWPSWGGSGAPCGAAGGGGSCSSGGDGGGGGGGE